MWESSINESRISPNRPTGWRDGARSTRALDRVAVYGGGWGRWRPLANVHVPSVSLISR